MNLRKGRRLRFRRRRMGETDYRRRLRLISGGKPRAVVRVTNTKVICQLVNYAPDGDKIMAAVNGSDLVTKFDWPESLSKKSVPAAYLSGFALANEALKGGHEEAVLDIGLARSTPGARIYAALQGMLDGGLNLPHGESILPTKERINGEHISSDIGEAIANTKTKIQEAYE